MSDLPQPEEVAVASFADDTAIVTVGDSVEEATEKLQRANKNKLRGFSPRANHTDRAAAAGRRS
jgi:hypothetical protein